MKTEQEHLQTGEESGRASQGSLASQLTDPLALIGSSSVASHDKW